MKNKFSFKVILILFVLIFISANIIIISCKNKSIKSEYTATSHVEANTEKSNADINKSKSINLSMRDFKEILTQMLPLLVSNNIFSDPTNREKIKIMLNDLEKSSQDVKHNPSMPYLDPSLRFLSTAFTNEIQRSKRSFEMNHLDYSRYILMNVMSFCIECHTRTASGVSFQSKELEKTMLDLNPLERGEYFVSIREFKSAQKEFLKIIQKQNSDPIRFFVLDRAIYNALTIEIKYNQNPTQALKIVKEVQESPHSPFYIKQNAKSWEQSLNEWINEKPLLSKKKTLEQAQHSPEKQLELAREWLKRGRNLQLHSSERSGDIYFLRALSHLHLILTQTLDKPTLGEALLLTGMAYDSVKDISLWSLHENYYEACIRNTPRTKWSEQCYKKLEESILFGYTGSSGIHIPLDVQLKLQELEKIALP